MESDEILEKTRQIWAEARDPQEWGGETAPDDDLIWKAGHPRQVKDLYSVGHLAGLPVRVAGSHRSKSVGLPVGIFRADIWKEEEVYFFTRDNFHDLKLVVVSSCPLEGLEYGDVHRQMTSGELFEEKMSSYNYSKPKDGREPPSGWDPSLYDDDRWFDKWCHDSLLRIDGEIYRCSSTFPGYYEGIDDLLPREAFVRYEKGRRVFCTEIRGGNPGWLRIMGTVVRAAQRFVQARRQHARDVEDLARYEADIEAGKELNDWHRKNKAEIEQRLAAAPA